MRYTRPTRNTAQRAAARRAETRGARKAVVAAVAAMSAAAAMLAASPADAKPRPAARPTLADRVTAAQLAVVVGHVKAHADRVDGAEGAAAVSRSVDEPLEPGPDLHAELNVRRRLEAVHAQDDARLRQARGVRSRPDVAAVDGPTLGGPRP